MNTRVEGIEYAEPMERRTLYAPIVFNKGEIRCQTCKLMEYDRRAEIRYCPLTGESLPQWNRLVGACCPLIEIKED